jgi:hypothetical protein
MKKKDGGVPAEVVVVVVMKASVTVVMVNKGHYSVEQRKDKP